MIILNNYNYNILITDKTLTGEEKKNPILITPKL